MANLKAGLLFVIIAAFILMPVFSFAQTPPQGGPGVVDKAQVQALLDKIKEARDKKTQEKSADNGTWKQLENEAIGLCNALSQELLSITKRRYGADWSKSGQECYVGTVSERVLAAGGTMSTKISYDEFFHNRVLGIAFVKDSGSTLPALDATTYQEWAAKNTQVTSENGGLISWLLSFVNAVFSFVANVIATVLAGLAIMALKLLHFVLDYTTFGKMPQVVTVTWTIVRDFMNLMFIIALIVMAIATIIRYESYNYKRILRNLIIMAVLINFSQVIATTLISFSDTLINTVKPQGTLTSYSTLIWDGFVTGNNGFTGGFLGQGYPFAESMGNNVTKIIALVFVTVAIAAVAALMLVRLIGLWFLVMISPAAYALNVLPFTQSLSKQWWNTFTKYLIWGPVTMFFFRVGLSILGSNITTDGSRLIETKEVWLNNLFVAAFLWGGFLVAKQAGMYGAEKITSAADKYAKAGSKFATSAYGNYFWRGNVAKLPIAPFEKLGFVKEGTGKKVQEFIGKGTAWIENEPKRQMDKWVNTPNKERTKLIEKQDRRSRIKRGYFKDIDEENAKKFSPEDFAYMMQTNKLNDDSLRSLMEHGKPNMKNAIAEAYKQGHIRTMVQNKKIDASTEVEVWGKVREHMAREIGISKKDIPSTFMPDSAVTNARQAFVYQDRNNNNHEIMVGTAKKASDSGTFNKGSYVDQMAKTRFEVDPDGHIRDDLRERRRVQRQQRQRRQPQQQPANPQPASTPASQGGRTSGPANLPTQPPQSRPDM